LGVWDAVFNFVESDSLILRKGADLFSLSIVHSNELKKLVTDRALIKSEILTGVEWNGHQWLLCDSYTAPPFALDLATARQVRFSLFGAKHGASVGTCVVQKQAGAAILKISGGEPVVLPRDVDEDFYAWMSLESGKTVRFSADWSLEYSSTDQMVAVFSKELPKNDRNLKQHLPGHPSRFLTGVNMKTGKEVNEFPDWTQYPWVKIDEGTQSSVRILMDPNQSKFGPPWSYAGFFVDDLPHPFATPPDSYCYPWASRAKGDCVFYLLYCGDASNRCRLMWAKLDTNLRPRRVADKVIDLEMLKLSRCVYVTSKGDSHHDILEPFVYDANTTECWNILDGIMRLPELTQAQQSLSLDMMAIRLIPGFGSDTHAGLVLCLVRQARHDSRNAIPLSHPEVPYVDFQDWNGAVLVSASGDRYLVSLSQHPDAQTKVWLHNSGKLFIGEQELVDDKSGKTGRMHLFEVDLGIDQSAPAKK
jgi:hypothetical protein